MFAHEGFVKACPVGWIPTIYDEQASWAKIWNNSLCRTRTCLDCCSTFSTSSFVTPYLVLPARCGAQEPQRALFCCLSIFSRYVSGRNPVGLRIAGKVYNVVGVNTLQHAPRVEPLVAILYRCFAVVPLQPRVV